MKKLAIAGASVALAAMPMAGVFAQDLSVTDTIQITVDSACTIDETNTTTDGLDTKDTTYAATVANGAEADFSGTHSGNHAFHVSCNAPGGWSFSVTPTDLAGFTDSNKTTTNNDSIPFVATGSYASAVSGTAGAWTATIASTVSTSQTITQPSTAGQANLVINATNAQASNVEITSTYQAYVGTETSAGFYEGTIAYNLAAL